MARVAADVHGWPTLNLVAAALWIAAFGAWVWKYAPIYVRPRSDGRPG
ncbi:MAG TPA: NnrS family protein [Plasticicumulans sp.]|nr:NnrS family protein [Plasticicumulans sp.]